MRRPFMLWLCLIWTLFQIQNGMAQRMLRYELDQPVICYYSAENRPDHVGVSDKFKRLRHSPTGRVKTATFDVEYINFPANNLAKTAFEYAIEIWESELVSSVPIKVKAEWRDLDAGVLGQALWGSAFANFGGEQHMNTFYPVALAEKITGRELNESTEADIVASFNSDVSWYLGTDGNTPDGKMDLVTIVLHEIAHGLGFTDTYDVVDNEGTVGLPNGSASVPFIFDVFVENGSGENLLHEFVPPSPQLASTLQGSDLFFDGDLSAEELSGVKPELFAPARFDNGSSISHLDEAAFNDAEDANRLMTPQIATAESIHDPGSLLMAMLSDLGWLYTYIDHEPLKDTERRNGQPYPVTAFFRSDNGYDPTTVELHYTTDGENFTTVDMAPTGVPDQFQASLPGTTAELAYAYFISVVDNEDRTFTNPGKMQELGKLPKQGTHFFHIGPDVDSPEIIHEPVAYISSDATHLELTAEVTDNQDVKEVVAEYFVNEGPIQTVVMDPVPGTDEYSVTVALPLLAIRDVIRYRFIATDVAVAQNFSTLPDEGFFEVTVTGILPVQDSYVNNFNQPSSDFFGSNFQITTPEGFEDGAIHSDHPYDNGIGPGDESNYTFRLQAPIRINEENPFIRFDEIVLVEPGEDGSEFPSASFFDYVVVEGSVDSGDTWEIFAEGYDSREHGVWLSRYNSDISNQNSQVEGEPLLFRPRSIDMLANGNFSPGDEVLIRFRLFADQLAHGWGWAIDNLSIQSPLTDAEESLSSAFSVYPVPVHDQLFVELNLYGGPLSIEIIDLQGKVFYREGLHAHHSTGLRTTIDVQFLENGLYLLIARAKDKMYVRKIMKVEE